MAETYQSSKHSRQSILKNKPAKYVAKLLVILFPMAVVPMASYDFLIFYFKHTTVIYASIVIGFMIGLNLLYISEKFPKKIFQKLPKIV